MATYALIHGAGSTSWYWHLVAPRLTALGHEVVAPDLPSDDDDAGFPEYADVVARVIGGRAGPIVVAQSLGGFTAPLVCDRVPVALIVLVAAMVPAPGESAGEWWEASGQAAALREADLAAGRDPDAPFDPVALFLHDVPAPVAAASAGHLRTQSATPFAAPWPRETWPRVPTEFLLCRDDRLFPALFMRDIARARLGLRADEMDGGHLPALADPAGLVGRLEDYRVRRGL